MCSFSSVWYLKGYNVLYRAHNFFSVANHFHGANKIVTSDDSFQNFCEWPSVSLGILLQKKNDISFFDVGAACLPFCAKLKRGQVAFLPLFPNCSFVLSRCCKRRVASS